MILRTSPPPPQSHLNIGKANLKDLKACNVQDANEVLPWQLGVQLLVDAGDHPQEQLLVDGFGEGIHSVVHLCRGSAPVWSLWAVAIGACIPSQPPGGHLPDPRSGPW